MRKRGRRRGQVGDYWLSKRPGSGDAWCRTWYDARSRQTRRASLDRPGIDITDFDQAEAELIAWVAEHQRPKQARPADVLLAAVLVGYWNDHASKIASKHDAKLCIRRFGAFWPGCTIDQITIAEQDRYIAARIKDGVSLSRVAREFVTLRAALRNAMKKGEIVSAPFIKYPETAEDLRNDQPFGRPLSMQEMAKLFNAAKTPRTRLFLMILSNTLCRPGAALELTRFQADFEHGLVTLNPPGRRQTGKFRPVVPMTKTLRRWLASAPGDRYLAYGSRKVTTAKNLWRRLRTDAGLGGRVNSYSIRHTMARELRKRRVPGEQIELMLGHRRPDATTQIYAPYAPDYCLDAAAAIDAYMAELQKFVSVPLVDPIVAGEKQA
jgi:integrase